MSLLISGFDFAPCRVALGAGELLLFCLPIPGEGDLPCDDTCLEGEERLRLQQFQVPEDARAFLGGRLLLRELLGAFLETGRVEIRLGPGGKPYCPHPRAPHFNLTHGGGWLAAAFSGECVVGVDVESLDRELPYLNLARRYFSDAEIAEVSNRGREAFIRIWTRKEARLKASGEGLRSKLSRFTADEPGWQFSQFHPAPRMLGTLAYPGPPRPLRVWAL